ncbi:hypothetical protein K488DRAFT_71725 [Vararia minispora EC-137]|uniref:Uncharacterized protein n=1 Tax=Vararia minispora EC-137 TaxID=1314806 RepID=A0ACB8QGT5_9AGAM|nr:hypothetical protein K488DRAFT_71725 [Vararia minispora EC-137]
MFRSHRADAEAQLPLLVELNDDPHVRTPFSPPPEYDSHHHHAHAAAPPRAPSQPTPRPPLRTRAGVPMPIPLLDVDPPTYGFPESSPSPLSTAAPLTPWRRAALALRFTAEMVFTLFSVIAALAFSALLAWGAAECARELLGVAAPTLAKLWVSWWSAADRTPAQGVRVAVATLLFPAVVVFVLAFAFCAALVVLGSIKFAIFATPHIVKARWLAMRAGE